MIETTLKDKVPPHDIEAERAVLGALLLNWEQWVMLLESYVQKDFIHYKIK